jgi:hypothetical protein
MAGRPNGARPRGPAQFAVLVAALLSAGASLLLLWLPINQGLTQSMRLRADGPSRGTTFQTEATLLETNGAGVAVLLVLPVVIATFPLLLRGHRGWRAAVWASAGVLCMFSLFTGFSIGAFYSPSVLALGVAAVFELLRPPAA